jgi:hypothetical protein
MIPSHASLAGGKMKKILVFALLFMITLPVLPQAQPTKAYTSSLEIRGYSGKIDAFLNQQRGGQISFDLTMDVYANEKADLNSFFLPQQKFIFATVEVDGRNILFTTGEYDINLNYPKTIEKGAHTVRFVYKYLFFSDKPELERLNIFANADHFHCFDGWYPIIKNEPFSDTVKFNLDVTISNEWFMLGSWVPPQFREKPKSDGKYKYSRVLSDPGEAKLVGGRYDVTKSGDDNMKLWIYTLKGVPSDAQYLAMVGKLANDYYTKWFGKAGKGEVIIGAMTGYYLGAVNIEGGYVIDAPGLNSQTITPDFLAREMARGWWGGLLSGATKQPDKRILQDSMSDFSAIQFLQDNIAPKYIDPYIKARLEYFWKSHFPGESSFYDEKTATNEFLVYSKAPFVIRALRGFVGKEAFDKAIVSFIDKYSPKDGQKAPETTLDDLKTEMENSFGSSIDEFWNIYFKTGKVVVPVADISRSDPNGGPLVETLRCRNLEETIFPLKFTVFGVDGKSEDFVFTGESNEFKCNVNVAGFANTNFDSLIPKPDTYGHTMGSGTIASILAWKKPTIICLDNNYMDRAKQWGDLTGEKVTNFKIDILPNTPIICVGPSAISFYALATAALLPVKTTIDRLVWHQVEVSGEFSKIMAYPDTDHYELPMIIDDGTGTLPKDLTWSGIFQESQDSLTLGFRNTIDGEFTPPTLEYVNTTWTERIVTVPDCRVDLTLSNATGMTVFYDGLSFEKFAFGRWEKKVTRQNMKMTFYLDLLKTANITVSRNDRFLLQLSEQEYVYGGNNKNFKGPGGLSVPKSVTGNNTTIKWNENMKYMYRFDGIGSRDWESGNSLLLNNMDAGIHKLEMVFYSDGIMSPIQTFEIASGVKPPALTLESKQVQCRDGKVIIKGKTDPEVTLDPPAKVNADGTFEMTINVDTCPKSVVVKAKNKFGLETSETVTVSSGNYVKIVMQIGSPTATDQSGNKYTLQVPPQIIKGSTYVPMRFVGERLGAEIQWDGNLRKVTYILGSTRVELIIGNAEAIVNGKKTKMPGAAVIVGGKTLVPVRFVAEALGAKVGYESATKTITIEYGTP